MDPKNELDRELLIGKLARLLYAEQESPESEEELIRMADTVLNRPEYAGYPDTPEEVMSQPGQYSPFNPKNKRNKVMLGFGPQHPRWAEYVGYAEKALDPARMRSKYTHYFAGDPPPWAGHMVGLTRIGDHWFGTEPRRKKLPGGEGVLVARKKEETE